MAMIEYYLGVEFGDILDGICRLMIFPLLQFGKSFAQRGWMGGPLKF